VFVAVVPSPGLSSGPSSLPNDRALATLTSLLRTDIDSWTSDGCRIVGLVHAGLGTHLMPGQRPEGEIAARVPMGASTTLEDVVDALRFLASPATGYLSGSILHVDGGLSAYSWVYPTRDY